MTDTMTKLIAFRLPESERDAINELARVHRLDTSELLRACVECTTEYARKNRLALPPTLAKRFPPVPASGLKKQGGGN